MKNFFFVATLVFILVAACHKPGLLPDGIYLVHRVVKTNEGSAGKQEMYVPFDSDFKEDAPEAAIGIVLGTEDYVPLQLGENPLIVSQSGDKKKLHLALSAPGAARLEVFTAQHIDHEAAIIVDGRAITVKKIRDTIKGGRMEITGCSEKACERIYLRLSGKQ